MGRHPRTDRGRRFAWLVLDSDGLSKAASGDLPVVAHLKAARLTEVPIVVSAVTLTEVLRGERRDAAVHLVLKGCRVAPVTAAIGRAAGELLGRTGRKDTVDAVVVATAACLGGPVRLLTSDPTDLSALTLDLPQLSVRAV